MNTSTEIKENKLRVLYTLCALNYQFKSRIENSPPRPSTRLNSYKVVLKTGYWGLKMHWGCNTGYILRADRINCLLWVALLLSVSLKGPLPTLMHCAPRTHISWISCNTKFLIVVKSLISVKTSYPFERLRLSVGINCHPFERFSLSVRKRNTIRSNDSGYPFVKNCHQQCYHP